MKTMFGELDSGLELIEKIQAGIQREESLRKLFNAYYHPVLLFFRRHGFTAEESRDLAQDTFLQIFKAIDNFRGESRVPVWIFGIATNVRRGELRRSRAVKRDGIEQSIDLPGEARFHHELVAMTAGPLDQAVRSEERNRIREALRKLPPQMSMCCLLRYERGLKYQEIATLMNISIETVKAHLHQARKRLAVALGDVSGDKIP